jgi:hypothetical protein
VFCKKPRHNGQAESPEGRNELDNVIRAIRVRDANGDELSLYEYEQTSSYLVMMGLNRGPVTRLVLDTGEEAERVDDDTFVLVTTGEQLTRIG